MPAHAQVDVLGEVVGVIRATHPPPEKALEGAVELPEHLGDALHRIRSSDERGHFPRCRCHAPPPKQPHHGAYVFPYTFVCYCPYTSVCQSCSAICEEAGGWSCWCAFAKAGKPNTRHRAISQVVCRSGFPGTQAAVRGGVPCSPRDRGCSSRPDGSRRSSPGPVPADRGSPGPGRFAG